MTVEYVEKNQENNDRKNQTNKQTKQLKLDDPTHEELCRNYVLEVASAMLVATCIC